MHRLANHSDTLGLSYCNWPLSLFALAVALAATSFLQAASDDSKVKPPEEIKLEAEETSEVASENTLSAEPELPLPQVEIPAGRPDWVESASIRKGDVHRTAVSSGPHFRMRECRRALDDEIQKSVDEYVEWYLGNGAASNFISIPLDEVKRRLLKDGYQEEIRVSVGPMQQSHALLEFDAAFRQRLDQEWKDTVARSRLLELGLVAGGVLALLLVISAYFRLDTATRGYYSGRLQFVAMGAILALVAAGVLAARWIPWL